MWEKFKDKIEAGVREASGLKEVIFEKARVSLESIFMLSHVTVDLPLERRKADKLQPTERQTSGLGILVGQQVKKTPTLCVQCLMCCMVCSFVFKSLREKMGLDRCRICVS